MELVCFWIRRIKQFLLQIARVLFKAIYSLRLSSFMTNGNGDVEH